MDDLISRQAAIDEIVKRTHLTWEHLKIIYPMLDVFEELPSAERHGRWEWNKRLCEWYCSNCDRIMTPYIVEKSEGEYEMAQPNYCGWCGAKMDEECEDEHR